jgi:hypothetical protein
MVAGAIGIAIFQWWGIEREPEETTACSSLVIPLQQHMVRILMCGNCAAGIRAQSCPLRQFFKRGFIVSDIDQALLSTQASNEFRTKMYRELYKFVHSIAWCCL